LGGVAKKSLREKVQGSREIASTRGLNGLVSHPKEKQNSKKKKGIELKEKERRKKICN